MKHSIGCETLLNIEVLLTYYYQDTFFCVLKKVIIFAKVYINLSKQKSL